VSKRHLVSLYLLRANLQFVLFIYPWLLLYNSLNLTLKILTCRFAIRYYLFNTDLHSMEVLLALLM
jgi:hypothetical protein